jgi:NADH-ubiquinone oxidoreductase chain 5
LVSYLLPIYHQNVRSYGAGMSTAVSNRIGDVALLMVITGIINCGSWNFIYYLEFLSSSFEMELTYFSIDNAHPMYNAHPILFLHSV